MVRATGIAPGTRLPALLFVLASAAVGVTTGPLGVGTASAAEITPQVISTYDLPFASPGGTTLRLDVHRLQGAAGLPSLALIHGGRWRSGDKSDVTQTAQRWATYGYVVFNINHRLATADTQEGEGVHHPAPLQDVQAAIGWIRDHAPQYGGDPEAIGIFGGSSGGHLALLAATQDPRLEAAISWSGPTDLSLMWRKGQETDALGVLLGCTYPESCPATEDASPITHVSQGDPPTYLANSTDEPVPPEQAQNMATALEGASVPHELQIVEGSLHSWALRRYAEVPTRSFLETHLCGRGPEPAISIGDVSATEAPGATVQFDVSLASPTCRAVSVAYATAQGSATAGADFLPAEGRLRIPAGSTGGTISVRLVDDEVVENDESFSVTLSSATGAVIGDPGGTATIRDGDEQEPSMLTVRDASIIEGDTETVIASFRVTLSRATDQQVTVSFATADGTATRGSDYRRTVGTLTILPGRTAATVRVKVLPDVLHESDEVFSLVLSSATGAAIRDGEGTGTIIDDDASR